VAVLQSRQQPCTCLLAEFWCTRCYMLANTQLANTQTLYCTSYGKCHAEPQLLRTLYTFL